MAPTDQAATPAAGGGRKRRTKADRAEALRYVATHVGHSRKRTLTPQQRLELMTQGQYGIGLLGFWSLGETLEIRSSMPGQRAHRLIIYRDRPDAAGGGAEHLPAAAWRSRLVDGRWQVNSGHREFRAIADRPTLKLRYLALLFAKEVVLRSSQDPRLEAPLEQLVEVAAYADRRLVGRPRGRKP